VPAAANIAILAQVVMLWVMMTIFDDEIVRVCNDLANQGIRVIVAGLIWTLKEILWTHAGSYGYCRIRN
jgi:hypothetical protein